MIYHYAKSFLISAKKNRFFYSINLIGFFTGFLLLVVIFSFVYQEFSFDRFHNNAENIYRIHSGGYGVTPLCFAEKLNNQIPEISSIVRFSKSSLTVLNHAEKVEIKNTYYTDPEIFSTFSFNLLSGNAADALREPFSIVLSQSTSKLLFAETNASGQTIRDCDGTTYTVTGIMEDIPFNSHIQSNAFISLETLRHSADSSMFDCGAWGNLTYVCLSDYANNQEAELKINTLLKEVRLGPEDNKVELELQPLTEIYFDGAQNKFDGSQHGNRQVVLVYSAISVLILLIVVINYVNLSLAIAASRTKEIAIRKVNGATKLQIVGQILFETFAFVLIAYAMASFLMELMLPELSSLLNLTISQSIARPALYLYYLFGMIGIGLIAGLIPGISLSKINVIKTLKNESVLSSHGYLRRIMLVFQLIIVAVLLNATFIMKSQLSYLLHKKLGYNYEQVVYFNLDKDLIADKEILKNSLVKNPKIQFISFSSGIMGGEFTKSFIEDETDEKLCNFYGVDPDYLDLYEIKMKYGRNFEWDMKTDIQQNCLINEEACRVFGLQQAIGKKLGGKTIIGVVEDFNFASLHHKVGALVIYRWGDENMAQIKISDRDSGETIEFIRDACKRISPDFQDNISFLENRINGLYNAEKNLKDSIMIYSIATFIIALLGLFGMTLFMIKKKSREIGLRKLFGSKPFDTFKLLSKEQMWLVVIANLLAMPISYLLMQKWLANFEYSVDIRGLVFFETFLITMAFTLIVIASLILKTHRMDLIKVLKKE